MSANQETTSDVKSPVSSDDIFIVGIGASAGGLQALEEFFKNVEAKSGLAYVVIQHLSPQYKSMMLELLAKHAKEIQFYRAENGMIVKPNHVYLLPPKKNMKISKGCLVLYDQPGGLNLPIDIFFHSLAEDKENKAIGVVLSGTGTDGTLGLRAIKGSGGITMVQEPSTAKYDGMPQSAIATGKVDHILSPEGMPPALSRYAKGLKIKIQHPDRAPSSYEDYLTKIIFILKKSSRVDFSQYRRTTIVRRIEKRMNMNQITGIEEYLEFLQENSEEVTLLFQDILIGVTRFFRDKEAFECIETTIIPQIFINMTGNREVRIWSAGCSTGEEAYSLAILFKEYIIKNKIDGLLIKIFATDIDKEALKHASAGSYPESIAADVSSERLNHFFVRRKDRYIVNNDIRNMVIFSCHDIIKDPPFVKLNVVSCRNLLIYMTPALQSRVISLFTYALNEKAYLFLGGSESIGEQDNSYTTINSKWRIFQRNEGRHRSILREINTPLFQVSDSQPLYSIESKGYVNVDHKIQDEFLRRYSPSGVVIDEMNEIVATFGDVNRYLRLPVGKTTLDLVRMCREDLYGTITMIVHKLKKENAPIKYNNIQIRDNNRDVVINIAAEPFGTGYRKVKLYSILFHEVIVQENPQITTVGIQYETSDHVRDLELELQYTKESLQSTIEELETSNEELQATNEELLASNEELQSTNEELQSVNEELVTVNNEYQMKIDELVQLNDDMDNLLVNTNIGVIFLDKQLCIRKFTPSVANLLNLIETDIGRPLQHFSFNFDYKDFYGDVEKVLLTLVPKSKEVKTKAGWNVVKIIPYRTNDDVIKGIVVTFVDITDYNKIEQALHRSQKMLNQVMSLRSAKGELRPMRILFVEDDPSYVKYWLNSLQKERIHNDVQVVMNGREMLNYLQKKGKYSDAIVPDIIFLDLTLPDMDGLELLNIVKSDDKLKLIPVVIVSDSKDEETMKKAYALHASGYVTKPLDVEQLQAIIKKTHEYWCTIVKLPDSDYA